MPTYAEKVMQRTDELLEKVDQIETDTLETGADVSSADMKATDELAELGQEIILLHEHAETTAERVKKTMEKLQQVVKRKELERLQKRVDAWAPEQNISREMLQRFLKD